MDNELINRFNDIDIKVDELIELCRSLQKEKLQMLSKIKQMETELEKKVVAQQTLSKTNTLIQSNIDQLLAKLENFAKDQPPDQLLHLEP